MYVGDDTNFGACTNSVDDSTECFLQVITLEEFDILPTQTVEFKDNQARISGSSIFGGLLDRCTVSEFADTRYHFVPDSSTASDGVTYLTGISNINISEPDSVSSYPVHVCFCKNNKPNCSYQPPTFYVEKGGSFTVQLVAVDQINHTANEAIIHCIPKSLVSGLGEGQLTQRSTSQCSD